jgi:hypothetical protein
LHNLAREVYCAITKSQQPKPAFPCLHCWARSELKDGEFHLMRACQAQAHSPLESSRRGHTRRRGGRVHRRCGGAPAILKLSRLRKISSSSYQIFGEDRLRRRRRGRGHGAVVAGRGGGRTADGGVDLGQSRSTLNGLGCTVLLGQCIRTVTQAILTGPRANGY